MRIMTFRTKFLTFILSAAAAVALVSHARMSHAQAPELAGSHWALGQINGEDARLGKDAGLVFDTAGTWVSASGGCNRFMGDVILSGDTLTFPKKMAGTLMACPPEIDAQERAFLAALKDVQRFEQEGETLRLLDKEQTILLQFERLPQDGS